jgi:L-lactate dehydrogenase complex protein LldG
MHGGRKSFQKSNREELRMATSNPSREAILARIRDGLRTPAPPIEDKTFYGPIFEAVENPLERFQQECKANLMECQLTADATASAQALTQVLQSLPPGEIFVQDDPVLRRLTPAAGFQRQVRWSSEGGPREQSQATITLADALIAQTGSIFVSASGGGRGASVVAPTHIVYAFANQLVPDLVTALRNATADGRLEKNSYACVISGSSRTADIEKILVQGAHGPMRLVVILETGP